MLILIAGLPGSGKTTIADAYARKYKAVHFNSDRIRREMNLRGAYSPEDKQRVYDNLLERAGNALRAGETVIVDSTFFRKSIRQPYIELAAGLGVRLVWVLATATESVLRARVARPRTDSEADEKVFEQIQTQFEPLDPPFLSVDTSTGSPDAHADAIHRYIEHG
ncbi:MAG: ATP-binding protein [Lewinellaceae bacterium]|nr:ATP-binding protein [Lewinellaceae bacterium]